MRRGERRRTDLPELVWREDICATKPVKGVDAAVLDAEIDHADLGISVEVEESYKGDRWRIVHLTDAVRDFFEGGPLPAPLAIAAPVYEQSHLEGELLFGSWRLTVVLRRLSGAAGARFLERKLGLDVLRRHLWSPSAYSIRVPRSLDNARDPAAYAREVADLCGRRLDWAYPELLTCVRRSGACELAMALECGLQWQWEMISAPEAWEISKGGETKVAVIDQGFDVGHPDYANDVDLETSGCFDSETGAFVPYSSENPDVLLADAGELGLYSAARLNVHGTACAGLAGACPSPDAASGIAGAAPHARLMLIRIGGYASGAIVGDALCHAMNPSALVDSGSAAPADIVSCSLIVSVGREETEHGVAGSAIGFWLDRPLHMALDLLAMRGRRRLGIPVCWSVRDKLVKISSSEPPFRKDVIGVGSSKEKDDTLFTCAWGPGLDLLAPGETVGVACPEVTCSDLKHCKSGTSFATPIVAGVAALVLSANEYLTAAEVKQILTSTCVKVSSVGITIPPDGGPGYTTGDYDWCPYRGHGRVDAKAAVDESVEMRTWWRRLRRRLGITLGRALPRFAGSGLS
jgi:hypothetical protein